MDRWDRPALGWVTAVVLVAAAWLFFAFARNAPREVPPARYGLVFRSGWRLYRLAVFYFITFGGFVAMAFLLPTLLQDWFDYSKGEASARAAGFIIAATLARPVGGLLADRVGAYPVLVLAFAGIAIDAAVLAAIAPEPRIVPVTIACLTLGAFLGAGNGAVFKLVPAEFPNEAGAAGGIVGAAGGLGGFFPPVFVGLVKDAEGTYTYGFVGLLVFVVVCLALAVWLLRTAPASECAAHRSRAPVAERRSFLDRPRFFAERRGGWSALSGRERKWESFYRDRWQHDRVVRSTHGVNCTGSCSWKIHVKDGIVTWETQQTDYPSNGPDVPEYEPRGCPRGASFSWYVYSPLRVRYPYVRGVLLELYREALASTGDPVDAWASDRRGPREGARATSRSAARAASSAHPGTRSPSMIAAAHVHTVRRYGPDRVAGFSPIPAMSMVSYAAGTRFLSLIGGVCLSLLRLVRGPPARLAADLGRPDRRPRVGRLVERRLRDPLGLEHPADAHAGRALHDRGALPGTEGRRRLARTTRGTRSSPTTGCPPQPGTDGALAMAMGHVILKEFYVERAGAVLRALRTRDTPTCRSS